MGRPVQVSKLVELVAQRAGLALDERMVRAIKQDRRYLPPPTPPARARSISACAKSRA